MQLNNLFGIIVIVFLFHTLDSVHNIYAGASKSHYGKEFYLGMISVRSFQPDFTIDIASQKAGTVFLSIPYLNIHRNQSLQKGTTTLTVNNSLIRAGTFTENRGIYLRTDETVAVYVTWKPHDYIMDTFLALPVSSIGVRYTVASYDPFEMGMGPDRSEMMIIAAFNNTNVNITSPSNGISTLNLNTYDVYQQGNGMDISCTEITSDKPVTVISGTSFALVPHDVSTGDLLLEQMIPKHAWGNKCIVSPLYPRLGYLLKVFSSNNATVCLQNNTVTICSNTSGIQEEYLLGTEPVVVTSNDSINVVQYGVGEAYDSTRGDEFMTVVPGLNNYLNSYYFVIPSAYSTLTNRLAITVPFTEVGGLLLDGSPLVSGKTYHVPDPFSNYTVLISNISTGYHELIHTKSQVLFGVTAYGLDYDIGYGFPVGFGFSSEKYTTTELPTTTPTSTTASSTVSSTKSTTSTTTASATASYSSSHLSTSGPRPNVTGIICYSCDDLSNVGLCDVVKHCNVDEVCFIKRQIRHGRHLYQTGCLQSTTCAQETETYKTIPDRCVQCCSQSYCNNLGCGDNGLVPRNQRGPLCYDCPYEQSPKDCNKLSLCEQHEVCSIEEFKWGANSHYIMGCTDELCNRSKRSVHMATRALPVCRSCCADDYCNLNCTRSDATSGIIVG